MVDREAAVFRIDWLTFDAMTTIECAGPFWIWLVCAAANLVVGAAYFELVRLFHRSLPRTKPKSSSRVLLLTAIKLFAACSCSHLFYVIRGFWPCNVLWATALTVVGVYAWLLVVRVRHFGVLNLLQVLEYGNQELRSLKLTMVQTTQTEATFGDDEQKDT